MQIKMYNRLLFVLLLSYTLFDTALSQCNDWQEYKDKKCLKVFENVGLKSFEEAKNFCHQQSIDSNLITITSDEEQTFIANFVFTTNEIVDNVWMGAKYVNSMFLWDIGINLTYTNWAAGFPKNLTDNCVEMSAASGSVGKWYDDSCKRKNAVVCEKLPSWSISHLQETMLSFRETLSSLKQNSSNLQESVADLKQNNTKLEENVAVLQINNSYLKDSVAVLKLNNTNLQDSVAVLKQSNANLQNSVSGLQQTNTNLQNSVTDLKQKNSNSEESLSKLKQTIIPIGFIYVQLPNRKSPNEIWPWMSWKEVTSLYSGLFFRAEGSGSGSFSTSSVITQEGNAPRITNIESSQGVSYTRGSSVPIDGWTPWIMTGGWSGRNVDIKIYTSGGEVRPRNTAIRIWERY